MKRLTKSQVTSLRYAKRKFSDGRVPPYLFRDYRTIKALIAAGFIEFEDDYGAPMYRFTHLGLDALERESKQVTAWESIDRRIKAERKS